MAWTQKESHRSMEQNRRPKYGSLPNYSNTIVDKDTENIQCRKDISLTNSAGNFGSQHAKKMFVIHTTQNSTPNGSRISICDLIL